MGQFISSRNSSRDDGGGLILYYHPLSFYSQKVSIGLRVPANDAIDPKLSRLISFRLVLRHHVILAII